MFLNNEKNSMTKIHLNINDIVNDSYEFMLETQQYLQELDMKMIKCEHIAIVNEDSNMITLAESEYKLKISEVVRNIWNKILVLLGNVIIEFNNFIIKARTAFSQTKFITKQIEVQAKSYKEKFGDDHTGYDLLIDIWKGIKKNKKYRHTIENPRTLLDLLNDSKKEFTNFNSEEANKLLNRLKIFEDKNLNDQDLNYNFKFDFDFEKDKYFTGCYDIITEYGSKWIDVLKSMRTEANKKAKNKTEYDEKDRHEAITCQLIINNCITFLQKIISQSISYLNSVYYFGVRLTNEVKGSDQEHGKKYYPSLYEDDYRKRNGKSYIDYDNLDDYEKEYKEEREKEKKEEREKEKKEEKI